MKYYVTYSKSMFDLATKPNSTIITVTLTFANAGTSNQISYDTKFTLIY